MWGPHSLNDLAGQSAPEVITRRNPCHITHHHQIPNSIKFFKVSTRSTCNYVGQQSNVHIVQKGKGAKIATVIAKMDNFGTRNFEGAKPYTINQNGANLVILKIGVKFDR